jgi:hypothetical protein
VVWRILASWYGLIVLSLVVGAAALWIWLLSTSPDERYRTCLREEVPVVEPIVTGDPADVFDFLRCSKPRDLTREQAVEVWRAVWEQQH